MGRSSQQTLKSFRSHAKKSCFTPCLFAWPLNWGKWCDFQPLSNKRHDKQLQSNFIALISTGCFLLIMLPHHVRMCITEKSTFSRYISQPSPPSPLNFVFNKLFFSEKPRIVEESCCVRLRLNWIASYALFVSYLWSCWWRCMVFPDWLSIF